MAVVIDTAGSSVLKLPFKPPTEPISVRAKRSPVDVFTSRGEFVHRLEIGEGACFKVSRFLRVFGILRWTVEPL